MNLTIVVDGEDANDCPPMAISGEEHCAGPHASRFPGVSEDGPPQAVVVLIVQISKEIHFQVHHSPPNTCCSLLMVRVEPNLMLASTQPSGSVLKLGEDDREVPAIPPRRFKLHGAWRLLADPQD
jgi:hypothetical protein